MGQQNIANLAELVTYKQRLTLALKSAKICVFEVDLVRQMYTCFENSEDIFGVPGDKILRQVQAFSVLKLEKFILAATDYFGHPLDSKVIVNAYKTILNGEPTSFEARLKAGNTNYTWCKIDVSPIMEHNKPVRMIGVITDISEIKAKTDLLTEQSHLDGFTGLFTKKYAEECIKDLLKQESHKKHGIILFDLDNFKKVNDTYGHIEGDRVLLGVSHSLKKTFRKTDIIGRFGGDEFIILFENVGNKAELVQYLKRLMNHNDNVYGVTKSVGISIYPNDGKDYKQLFIKADEALYHSKFRKNQFTFFDEI